MFKEAGSISILSAELSKALSEERFGDAAKLRDEIKGIRNCQKDTQLSDDALLRTIQEKKETLKTCIDNERFEEAAKLRDEIKDLKSQVKSAICTTFRQDSEALNADLRAALSAERFEEAAVIRDKIRYSNAPCAEPTVCTPRQPSSNIAQ